MSVTGPKLGRTLLTVPKCKAAESSIGMESDYPGLRIENLKHALERGQIQSSLGINPDIQSFYHKLKEMQRQQPETPKNSFSIDSLAKSASNPQNSFIPKSAPIGFTSQHQELYRKALENLHNVQRLTPGIVPTQGMNQFIGMRSGLFPAQRAHFLHQAHMARLQAQRHSQNQEHRMASRGSAMKLSSSIVREAKNQLKGLDPENMYIECPLCHKRIKRLYHFQRHMRIHSGEKSHQCPYCPYKSVRKDNLKSHLKTHEKHAMEARRRQLRNAEMLDKKRTTDFEAIRRLQFNAMKNMTSQLPQLTHLAPHSQPVPKPQIFETFSLKDEPVAKITEIDSGCESPQEQSSPMRPVFQSDSSGIESGQSDRHSSKESDSTFSNGESPDHHVDVTK